MDDTKDKLEKLLKVDNFNRLPLFMENAKLIPKKKNLKEYKKITVEKYGTTNFRHTVYRKPISTFL